MSITKFSATAEALNCGDVFTTHLKVGDHEMMADEPITIGGKDSGPSPAAYLCMSLASCTAITLRMYVKRKGWDVENIKVNVTFEKADNPGEPNTFLCSLEFDGQIDEEQRAKLLEISKACPVHRLLGKPNHVITTIE
ncbi:OsmC family protein [Taibaiella soli]|nr:OsmC family protein [Taibaiella soli]